MATTVKERPILFSGEMVRAILDDRKTQTRRVLKEQPPKCDGRWSWIASSTERGEEGKFRYSWADANGSSFTSRGRESGVSFACPYGRIGDRIRISEEVKVKAICEDWYSVHFKADNLYLERSCDTDLMQRIKNYKTGVLRGVHLPPAFARPTRLEITGVRVERLNNISEEDAIAEGIEPSSNGVCFKDYRFNRMNVVIPAYSYMTLWESINGPGSWALNPWVWVVEFRRIEATK